MAIGEAYEEFTEKFKSKKTTDDCYTPVEVYNIVLDYVWLSCDIEGREVVRPFYPGGDYENYDYPHNCVVIDNPPFSIITQIVRFYLARGIDFFLFAPHLTLFSANLDCTRIVAGAEIIYENGANVKTSFMSNMFGGTGVMSCPYIHDAVRRLNKSKAVNLPKYAYPDNVLTVSMAAKWAERGIEVRLDKEEMLRIGTLDAQRPHKKSIFGGGYLISDRAAQAKAEAEAEAERAKKEEEQGLTTIVWELSEKEKDIIMLM